MGLGAVIEAPDGRILHLSCAGPGHGCNNEAEIRAVIEAMTLARAHGAQRLRIQSDNSILIDQLRHTESPPLARLHPLILEARAQSLGFEAIEWVWVPRHRNREADALARAALGLQPKAAAGPARRRRSSA